MPREVEVNEDGTTISFRLFQPQVGMLQRLAEAARVKSLHELSRTLLISALDQQSARDALTEVAEARADIDELRKSLARSVEAILLNLRTELSEEEIRDWVFRKLWPESK